MSTPNNEAEASTLFTQFVTGSSIGQSAVIDGKDLHQNGYGHYHIRDSQAEFHCHECNGDRVHVMAETFVKPGYSVLTFFFVCRNCEKWMQVFVAESRFDKANKSLRLTKVAEMPPFGERFPPRVDKLVGEDKAYLIKGRRCENRGDGIAAYAYYRRVVENQRTRLLQEILKVAQRSGSTPDIVEGLEKALREPSFDRTISAAKPLIPKRLYIKDENPLTLLYPPLSKGIHQMTDDECISLAKAVRVVLIELADRMGELLKDTKEIEDAVTVLTKVKGGIA